MPIGKRVGLINKYLLLVIGLLHPLMLCGVKGDCKIDFSLKCTVQAINNGSFVLYILFFFYRLLKERMMWRDWTRKRTWKRTWK